MGYERQIAFRHLRARRSRSLSVVAWLAITGVALGVAALVGGFSVTTGFEREVHQKVMAVTAHVMVRQYGLRFRMYDEAQRRVEAVPGVVASSPMTFDEALLAGRDGTMGAVVKGIIPTRAARVLGIAQRLVGGTFSDLDRKDSDGVEGIILGTNLARSLGVKTGELITIVSPFRSHKATKWGIQGSGPSSIPLRVRAIFKAGYHEYDSRLAYIRLDVAQRFFGNGDAILGLEVKVEDPLQAGLLSKRIEAALGGDQYRVMDWRRQNKNLFTSLTIQRIAILVVLSVMVILASCNVACMLIMVVLERTKDIAILKAMGARNSSIVRIFMTEGLLVGTVGTALGIALAYGLFEGILAHGVSIDPKVYGVAHLPIVFDPLDYVMASIGAILITLTATIFPALRAASLSPADGLREVL